jgi:MFS family permease
MATLAAPSFDTDVPLRLDRLPWSRWHVKMVIALGITWILDGLEVTLVGSVASVLREPDTLGLTESQVGLAATAYLAGAIAGSLFFGWLTDRLGRKRLFLVTLTVYLSATMLTAFSWDFASFLFFRLLTGAGIGGEYSAVNSAIDELVPARIRGRIDLGINASYWIGAALGAAGTLVLLNPAILPHALGWRLCFGLGASLGLAVVLVRRHLPESPRWLLLHGRFDEAEELIGTIEHEVAKSTGEIPAVTRTIRISPRGRVKLNHVWDVLIRQHSRRSVYCMSLMVSQAFCYNSIFFTYSLVLSRFYGVPSSKVGLYLLPFALGNFIGPLLLGPLFDHWGRRRMIASTYLLSAFLLSATGYGFAHGYLTAASQTVLWSAVFFFASAAASSAYLSASELFPVELRGLAIAVFYAAGTAAGGLLAPALFGALIQTGRRVEVFRGYLLGAALMAAAALIAMWLGVSAERKSLEELASPHV